MKKNTWITLIATAAAAFTIYVNSAAPAYADEGTYNDLVHWVDWMAKKYNMGIVYVDHAPMEQGTYGASMGRTIVFNSYYVEHPDELHSALVSDVASGYHPGLHCTATQVLAAHEAAHVLDAITGFSARNELAYALASGLSGEVSSYSFNEDGTVNYGEALADAMVAVECDVPTPAQSALYAMLTS